MASSVEQSQKADKKRGRPKGGVTKKTAAGDTDKKKKSRRVKKPQHYTGYIRKVLKQVHPEVGINSKTMRIMDSFCKDLYGKLVAEAGSLLKHSKRETLSDHDVQSAVKLVLPGELAKHAASEGAKAVTTYKATIVRKEKKKKAAEVDASETAGVDETAEETIETTA